MLIQQAPLAATDVAGRLKQKVICEALHDIQLPDKNRTTTVYSITQVVRCVKKLKQGKSPSTGMAKAEHLKPLAYRAAQCPEASWKVAIRFWAIERTANLCAEDPEIPQQRICRRKDGCGKCVWHVDRKLLAAMLFDMPATKPLWRYFHMRYGRYATHHVFGAEYDGTIRSSVGLKPRRSDIFFSVRILVSDLRVPSAVDVLQIHDDTYVVTTPDKVDSCLSELQEYYRGKQLRLRPQKTKILDSLCDTDRLAVNAVPKILSGLITLFASFSRRIASQTPVVHLGAVASSAG